MRRATLCVPACVIHSLLFAISCPDRPRRVSWWGRIVVGGKMRVLGTPNLRPALASKSRVNLPSASNYTSRRLLGAPSPPQHPAAWEGLGVKTHRDDALQRRSRAGRRVDDIDAAQRRSHSIRIRRVNPTSLFPQTTIVYTGAYEYSFLVAYIPD